MHLLRKERLLERGVPHELSYLTAELIQHSIVLPQLLADVERVMASWPDSGQLNPFDNIYNVGLPPLTTALT